METRVGLEGREEVAVLERVVGVILVDKVRFKQEEG